MRVPAFWATSGAADDDAILALRARGGRGAAATAGSGQQTTACVAAGLGEAAGEPGGRSRPDEGNAESHCRDQREPQHGRWTEGECHLEVPAAAEAAGELGHGAGNANRSDSDEAGRDAARAGDGDRSAQPEITAGSSAEVEVRWRGRISGATSAAGGYGGAAGLAVASTAGIFGQRHAVASRGRRCPPGLEVGRAAACGRHCGRPTNVEADAYGGPAQRAASSAAGACRGTTEHAAAQHAAARAVGSRAELRSEGVADGAAPKQRRGSEKAASSGIAGTGVGRAAATTAAAAATRTGGAG